MGNVPGEIVGGRRGRSSFVVARGRRETSRAGVRLGLFEWRAFEFEVSHGQSRWMVLGPNKLKVTGGAKSGFAWEKTLLWWYYNGLPPPAPEAK
jgi:hypothetical protein